MPTTEPSGRLNEGWLGFLAESSAVPPLRQIAALLAQLHGEKGHPQIWGIYQNEENGAPVVPISTQLSHPVLSGV